MNPGHNRGYFGFGFNLLTNIYILVNFTQTCRFCAFCEKSENLAILGLDAHMATVTPTEEPLPL